MMQFRAVVCAALFLFAGAKSAISQDVFLKSHDGEVEISGTLLGFDGEFYRVQTIYGELTIDGSGVLCEGPACPNLINFVADVSISGSASMADVLMPALLEAFARSEGYDLRREEESARRFTYILSAPDAGPNLAKFHFHASSADEGFADLLADEADIAMSLREIRASEAELGYEAGLGDMTDPKRSRVLALDGMVPIVASDNPVAALSLAQLADIFAGNISNWAELGGPDAPISPHIGAADTGFGQATEDQLMAPANLVTAETAVRHLDNRALVSAVARDPFAIGIASYAHHGDTQIVTLRGSCGFALTASRLTLKTEDYPLNAPMFLYFPARRLPKIARDFLAYTRGPAAQIVIRRAGFVDQTPEEVPMAVQGDRLANAISVAGEEVSLPDLQRLIETLSGMKRLSLSFRFQAGSSKLDAQSRSNVQQLAQALEAGLYDSRSLFFVGFSDGNGPAAGNQKIAEKRADSVRQAVFAAAETAQAARMDVQVHAFGEAMPMACDDTAWGRQVNRRVEVWVK